MPKQGRIGQAVVACHFIGGGSHVELRFTWVGHPYFMPLLNRCPEYENRFNRSRIRPGTGAEPPITFEPLLGQTVPFLNSHEYAVLIRWDSANPTEGPRILGSGLASDFRKAQAAVETANNTYVDHGPRPIGVPVKKKVILKDSREVSLEDGKRYRVKSSGHVYSGTLKEIVDQFARAIEDDPTDMLLMGQWEFKGKDDIYLPCSDRPQFPKPNQMLLDAFKKRA